MVQTNLAALHPDIFGLFPTFWGLIVYNFDLKDLFKKIQHTLYLGL